MKILFGMESIAFQSSAFFKELTQACQHVRDEAKTLPNVEFFRQPCLVAVTDLIKRYTGLHVVWDPIMAGDGPLMLTPIYTLNHVFFTDTDRQDKVELLDPARIVEFMKKPLLQGTIDLERARVDGDFSEIPQRLAVPQAFMHVGLWLGVTLSCEEAAAILLHEVGHAFIELEFMDRVATTNHVLAGLTAARLDTDQTRKNLVYSTAALQLRLTAEQSEALKKAQNDDSLTVIMATIAVEKSRSELGESVFDQTACEHLADQFAARHGAAQPLITAMAKAVERNPNAGANWRWTRDCVLFALGGLLLLPISLVVLLNFHLYEDRYGSFRTRILRTRNEIIERLKNRALVPEEREQLLKALKTAEDVIDAESTKMSFFEGVAYFVNSKYRHNYDYRLLQQKLESYTHSPLFGQAARLAAL